MNLKDLENDVKSMEATMFGKREEETIQPTEVVEEPVVEATESVSIESPTREDEETDDPSERKERNDWKKRYKSLKAHHDSSQHSLRQEVAALTQDNIDLQTAYDKVYAELNDLRNSSEDIYNNLFSEEQRDIVGQDTLGAIKLAVNESTKSLREELERERKLRLQEKAQRVEDLTTTNTTTFLTRLSELAPNYEQYDTDPKFHQWMSEPDELSGVIRSVIFKNAQSIGNVGQVAKFFTDFADLGKTHEKILEANISPTSKQSSGAVPQKKENNNEVISHKEILKFYEDCTMGKYKGRAKLRLQLQEKYDEAQRRGLIR
jgi:hypothetical protein